MKKNNEKYSTTQKNKKIFLKEIPLNKILFFTSITFCTLIIITLLINFYLIILINFTRPKNVNSEIKEVITIPYFLKRPDLLSSSKALIVYDASEDQIIYSKNENLKFSPASTAKIMASLVVMDKYSLSKVLTYPYTLISPDNSKMGLFIGEKMNIKNLIYGMLLPSGNDAALLIARNFPGGERNFVQEMNRKAKEIGMVNTKFTDPAGYNDENYSTAFDLALLGSHAIKNSFIKQVVSTKDIIVKDESGMISHQLKNLNELLEIPGVNGIKTGFTNEAEGVLITSFSYNKSSYIIVVLRSKDRFQDTKELINGIINSLKTKEIRVNS